MSIHIYPVKFSEREQLGIFLQQYLKELAPINAVKEKLDYPYFEAYWEEEKRIPLVLKKKEEWIGFALINDFVLWEEDEEETKAIAEFYIIPKYRRHGMGKAFAIQIFDKYASNWEIRQEMNNIPAQHFWRNIIKEYTSDNFIEKEIQTADYHCMIQLFARPNTNI